MNNFSWIHRRARRIMRFYDMAPGSCKCIRVAVMAAYADWRGMNGLPILPTEI